MGHVAAHDGPMTRGGHTHQPSVRLLLGWGGYLEGAPVPCLGLGSPPSHLGAPVTSQLDPSIGPPVPPVIGHPSCYWSPSSLPLLVPPVPPLLVPPAPPITGSPFSPITGPPAPPITGSPVSPVTGPPSSRPVPAGCHLPGRVPSQPDAAGPGSIGDGNRDQDWYRDRDGDRDGDRNRDRAQRLR